MTTTTIIFAALVTISSFSEEFIPDQPVTSLNKYIPTQEQISSLNKSWETEKGIKSEKEPVEIPDLPAEDE